VTFNGVQFSTVTGIGSAGTTNGPAAMLSFLGCKFLNTRLWVGSSNHRHMSILNNTFLFSVLATAAFNVIELAASVSEGEKTIKNNHIQSTVTQPDGTMGIYVVESDYNSNPGVWIEGNQVKLNMDAIYVVWSGTNVSTRARVFIRNNLIKSARVVSAGAASAAILVAAENYDRSGNAVTVATT
jgi:hypothetical protein